MAKLSAKLAAALAANDTTRVKKLRARIKRREQQQASGGGAGATGASLLTPSTLVVDDEMAQPATPATMDNAKKATPGGKSMQWKRAATDTEEGVVKGLPSWPIEGWCVSKHTKKDSSPYFM